MKLFRGKSRDVDDSHEKALWEGNSMSFLLYKCLSIFLQLAKGE